MILLPEGNALIVLKKVGTMNLSPKDQHEMKERKIINNIDLSQVLVVTILKSLMQSIV